MNSSILLKMRETKFIQDNQEKWKEYEEVLQKEYQDPDKLNEIFINVTDDLSYARTFYKNRSVRVYLNDLAQKIFTNLYKNKQSPAQRFLNFWKEELPKLVYDARKDFLLSFLVFAGACLIGALSTAMDVEFPRIIMGDEYVDMTIENIKKGDPMAVYKERGQFGMSVGITINNIFVALLTFAMGVFAAIGAIGILIRNGVMVGAFQYFFYTQGVFTESFLTIWMHGTLEISAIIIAGAAGITMGKGWVFPGTLSRLKSFQISARRGLKIMMGLVPIFITAGFIEGYITRHTELPDLLRASFIFICLVFVLWYFVWYPYYKAKHGFNISETRYQLQPDVLQAIDFGTIKKTGGLFADTFIFYRNHFWTILLSAIFASLFYGLTILSLHEADNFSDLFYFDSIFQHMGQYFTHEKILLLPVIAILTFTGCSIYFNQLILRQANHFSEPNNRFEGWLLFLKTMLPVTLMYLLIRIGDKYTALFVLLLFPVILLWMFIMQKEKVWYVQGLVKCFDLMGAAYFKLISLSFTILVISGLFYSLLDTSLSWFFVDIVSWNLPFKGMAGKNVLHGFMLFATLFALFLLYPLWLFGVDLYAFSQTEVKTAASLKKRIAAIGRKKEIRGMAVE